ncbi:hypothetical protein DL766_006370 [Monosporascus sp. MC13-8B]|uniref:FAD-binding domain-containing protein n=1 Tax=Monosporascus cannonballus TaxID=155416 RepID=A0ABY0H1T0_9PEZI|nr:hypothetical protein DL762_007985 [Monosporascus cannonballus]RYO84783.1 hypothetical protein DL763_007348 [Monosporascus cannonballus]RYP27460.1 hypothetical protein DL766_006370 [Monosporascus sp. MC13-8B]
MLSNKQFKIIIAGRGITGLTLAVMFEKFNIDYTLLETHWNIAPSVGASIDLFPNGLRILDQIGCVEPMRKLFVDPLTDLYIRTRNRKAVVKWENSQEHIRRRHGYQLLFFDRQWMLQVLYDQVQHKENILVNKPVVRIDLVNGSVYIKTNDGGSYEGSLIIRGGRVHSAVRQEMIRLGQKLQPGYFEGNESDRVPCYYQCGFGIAKDVPNWIVGEQNTVTGDGLPQQVVSGPDNRAVHQKYRYLPINEKVTFGQVFDNRFTSTLTSLHEIVYKKWFFRMILLFGNSVHKPDPIGGQGGNGAIESAAEFFNALLKLRNARPNGLADLSDQDLEILFGQMQGARQARAETFVKAAHDQQALSTFDNPLASSLIYKFVFPLAGDELLQNMFGKNFLDAAKIKYLPIPRRPRIVPYTDELPRKPLGQTTSRLARYAFAVMMALLLLVTAKMSRFSLSCLVHDRVGLALPGPFGLDKASEMNVSASSIPAIDQDPAFKIHLMHFFTQLISPILFYTIEGYRIRNRGTLLYFPGVLLAAMQFQGAGRVAPLHALLSALFAGECALASLAGCARRVAAR